MNTLILSGVKIGKGAIIGAGAVVAKDIPAYAIAVGNPCRVVKYRFNQEIIKKIEKFKYLEYKFSNKEFLYQEINEKNIEKIIKKLELDKCK